MLDVAIVSAEAAAGLLLFLGRGLEADELPSCLCLSWLSWGEEGTAVAETVPLWTGSTMTAAGLSDEEGFEEELLPSLLSLVQVRWRLDGLAFVVEEDAEEED